MLPVELFSFDRKLVPLLGVETELWAWVTNTPCHYRGGTYVHKATYLSQSQNYWGGPALQLKPPNPKAGCS